ncbi:uncharacterized protein L3040_008088 [Drepanopeziza brunnea f. sp. 'multigermtubi']|uniref:Uncharacterized protein n=1 Tax=Marssonina brunnea f. sp. multigermtubi (strain MB_m1) TaxID=1072389 RepID=K1WJA8_MARBU|nr:uncharacterized protein MBM_04094 [Drepanopeziza brunnea f. sp. 'multigermtubi' MB_m1]EKD17725.1 hypothetical protein MBM_04094 [Drepanopeziza brunnea f. sp. 'multigermtubi' MB_m1]KAJ5035623.1 hypothetical protein L3040_008088 [Drepanopeziza brunnea f. sp. 'multigermtubi']
MDAITSSPDPLSNSPAAYLPAKPPPASRNTRRSLTLQGSSPKKQTFDLEVGNELSPQKIRITVEAENPGAQNAHAYFDDGASVSPTRAPTNRRREHTTTTTIPVKGLSDSGDDKPRAITPKRGRGRPRKSGTPVAAKKSSRASTPARKNKRNSIGDLVDGNKENDNNYQVGKGVANGGGKGKSRSRSAKGTRKSTPTTKEVEASTKRSSSAVRKNGKGRTKSIPPEQVEVLEDESGQGNDNDYDYGAEEAGLEGALERIDSNIRNTPSAYSTIRSTTTIGGEDADVVIARFDPGRETPRQTGWSSPQVTRPGPSISKQRAHGHPSQSVDPANSTYSRGSGEGMMMTHTPDHHVRRNSYETNELHPGLQNDEEDEDEVGDIGEFDTILESEGFSMISVDSVPSLREHLSSSPANHYAKQPSGQAKNKSLLSARAHETAYEDSFSAIPEEVIEAATPGRKAQNPRLLSIQHGRLDDSCSSIPPDVLDAATTQRKVPQNKSSAINLEVDGQCADSFSAIPPPMSDAATPGRVRQGHYPPDTLDVTAPRRCAAPHASSPAPARLITPDETPSPAGERPVAESHVSNDRPSSSRSAARQTEAPERSQNSPVIHSQLPSSPPSIAPRRYTYTAHLRQHRQLNPDVTQTPSVVFSSPALPPRLQVGRGAPLLAPPEKNEPKPLSPTVRAGQMLQDIVVPSSSSRSRSQSLGSPFKSPSAKRPSSSAAQESYPSPGNVRLAGPLPRLDLSGQFSEGSSQRTHSLSHHQEDPFRSSALPQQRSPSPEQKSQYILELPRGQHSDSHVDNIRSEASFRGADDMSWQAEQEVHVPESIALARNSGSQSEHRASNSMSAEESLAAERALVIKQISNANSSKIVVIDSDNESSNNGRPADEDDEDFGLLLETLNSSSPVVERQQDLPLEIVEKPRGSRLPSPWRKNSKRLVYSDELSHVQSSPPLAEHVPPKRPARDLISQPLAVQQGLIDGGIDADLSGYQIPQKANFKPRPRETRDFNLSALLAASPPRRLPTLSGLSQQSVFQGPSSSSQVSSSAALKEAVSEPSRQTAQDSSEFGPIQSKIDFKPWRSADAVCSSIPSAESSTESARQGALKSTDYAPIPQKMGFKPRPLAETSSSLFAPRQSAAEQAKHRASKETGFTPIPQKMGFKPRARAILSTSPIKPASQVPNLFSKPPPNQTIKFPEPQSSSPVSTPLAAASPSRTNTLSGYHTPTASAQLSPSAYSPESATSNTSEKEQILAIKSRTQRWAESLPLRIETTVHVALQTPPRQVPASQTKSCLRSPLKTPSTQNPSSGNGGENLSPSKGVTFASSSPTPESPIAPLSACTWSKDHWQLLDTIVQAWKPSPSSEPGSRSKRRNSTRVISRLLGKTVRSGGDSMQLEQWHLEAVDEFRGMVPGWQEKVIAMRVFALLVGEEKRAAGLVGGGSGRSGEYAHLA